MNRNLWITFGGTATLALVAVLTVVGLRMKTCVPRPVTSAMPAEETPANSTPIMTSPQTERPDSGTYVPRMPEQALQMLNEGKPTQSDIEEIYAFLCSHGLPQGMAQVNLHTLKSGIMSSLQSSQNARDTLSQVLISIAGDSGQDPVTRDYAVQHFASWYPDAPNQAAIAAALWSALKEKDTSIAGSALLGLMQLSRDRPQQFERRKVEESAMKLAGDSACGELSRITALQVCGQLAVEGVLPLAEQLAGTATSMTLRTAAIATLADVGGQEVAPLLREYAQGEDPRLAVVGRWALDRLEEKEGPSGIRGGFFIERSRGIGRVCPDERARHV